MSIQDAARAQYDRVASRYDRLWQGYTSRTLDFLIPELRLSGREAILDVGCGTGELERKLPANYPGLILTGVDLSEGMLAVARAKLATYPNVTLIQAPADKLPFPGASFDLVVSSSAFHYFDDPHAALAEMARVLKPGGRLVIQDWCRDDWFWRLSDPILRLLDPAHPGSYTLAEMRSLLKKSGWRILRHQHARLGPLYGMMLFEASPVP